MYQEADHAAQLGGLDLRHQDSLHNQVAAHKMLSSKRGKLVPSRVPVGPETDRLEKKAVELSLGTITLLPLNCLSLLVQIQGSRKVTAVIMPIVHLVLIQVKSDADSAKVQDVCLPSDCDNDMLFTPNVSSLNYRSYAPA